MSVGDLGRLMRTTIDDLAGRSLLWEVGMDPASPGGPLRFTPTSVTASIGSTVNFRFTSPGNHSVTQSSFQNPCIPLDGGLDSGFQPVSADTTSVFPEWSFAVENGTQPLWFFCRQSSPIYHCPDMLFAVNPPTDPGTSYQDFARNAHRDAIISSVFTTNGVARTAYASPIPNSVTDGSAITTTAVPNATGASQIAIPISVFTVNGVLTTSYGFKAQLQATSSTSSKSSIEPTQSRTSSAPPSPGTRVPVAAIVGSVIGVMILLLLCLVTILVRRRRRQRAGRYEPHTFDGSTESGILQEHLNEARVYPESHMLSLDSEKSRTYRWSRVGSSADGSMLHPAARSALGSMMEEMQALRTQMQRLEMERQPSGSGPPNEPPPQYTAQ
ncbi:hypothetical protein MVEN_02223900 [Mycena venus]|uniref:Extracellular serine-rich protein n=1 Tax=Mycena venus TaxID=2733690 RepID=A0A8H6X807_9AGAR|nr:hypothetical protein MVEN_02223900 [Mycena venus]